MSRKNRCWSCGQLLDSSSDYCLFCGGSDSFDFRSDNRRTFGFNDFT